MTARWRRLLATATVGSAATAVAALFPPAAWGHASLIAREDLPLPEWLFVYGSVVVLVASFVGLLLGWRRPQLEGRQARALGGLPSRGLLGRVAAAVAGAIGVGLLVLVVWTGLAGTSAPDRNFAVPFVFVTFWLGTVVLSVLFGDVFRAFNPWRAIGRAASAGFAALAGQRAPAPLAYPERLGRWPAVVGLVAFLLMELVVAQASGSVAGISPRDVAIATLVYSAITFVAMALFGVERWIDRGETFSQYFGMFASLSPLTAENGRLAVRRPLSGSTRWAGPAGSLALVLVAIGGTTFDGAQEGLLADPIGSLDASLTDAGLSALAAQRASNTLFLLLALAAVALIFWGGILGMRIVERRMGARELGAAFAHAFVPIALAYLVAHYFSYVIYLEQAQFTFLLSDPFGTGADLLGTADTGIDYTFLGASVIQYTQFGSIVVGHVMALALGHDRALAIWRDPRDAAWSQAWMLVMMSFFSVLGLLLLARANG